MKITSACPVPSLDLTIVLYDEAVGAFEFKACVGLCVVGGALISPLVLIDGDFVPATTLEGYVGVVPAGTSPIGLIERRSVSGDGPQEVSGGLSPG